MEWKLTHHYVHARELRPDLCEHADVRAVDHLRREKFPVGDIGVRSLKLDDFSDLSHLLLDEWRVNVAFGVDQSKHADGIFPPVLLGQPTRRLWQEDESEEEEDGGEHLETPWNSESCGAVEERTSVRDVEHN